MVDILFEDGTPVPDPNKRGRNLSYHVDKGMKRFLDKGIKDRILKNDKDYVMLVDGYEGAGKSTFAAQVGRYVDPTLDLSRVCMTADEFKKGIMGAKKGNCVIYDEAVTGLSAGESITRIGRLLKSMMMQMRQKNLFVIIILPSVFEFNKYAVLSRARSFFHIYESGGRMGYWIGFNRKAMRMVYLLGKKTHSYKVRSHFRGRFYGKYAINEDLYRKKKEEALEAMDDVDGKSGESKNAYEKQVGYVNWFLELKRQTNLTQPEFCEKLQGMGITLKRDNLAYMLARMRKEGKIVGVSQ